MRARELRLGVIFPECGAAQRVCPSASIIRVMSGLLAAEKSDRQVRSISQINDRTGGIVKEPGARPFFAHHRRMILVAPLALEHAFVEEVPFLFIPAAPSARRRRVAAIGGGDERLSASVPEGEIYHGSRGLAGETVVLVWPAQRCNRFLRFAASFG